MSDQHTGFDCHYPSSNSFVSSVKSSVILSCLQDFKLGSLDSNYGSLIRKKQKKNTEEYITSEPQKSTAENASSYCFELGALAPEINPVSS